MTFSLVGRCARTGMLGHRRVVVQPGGRRPLRARRGPGVGAACSQNVTDPRLGPRLLDRLAAGARPGGA